MSLVCSINIQCFLLHPFCTILTTIIKIKTAWAVNQDEALLTICFLYLLRMCCFTYTNMPHCLGHYSRYLSILDVDQKTLRCPAYSGTLLNPLVEARSHFKRGNTYFMFAQTVQSKLVITALLLTFSQGFHTPRRPRESTWTECFHSEIHRDDKKILNYLSELIKLHVMEVPPNFLRFSYTTNSIFKL